MKFSFSAVLMDNDGVVTCGYLLLNGQELVIDYLYNGEIFDVYLR